MGYYSERIKGSNLQKWVRKAIWITLGLNAVMGVAIYYSPGMQRILKLADSGYFDESPEDIRKRMNLQLQLQGSPFMNITSKEDYDRRAAKRRSESFDSFGSNPK